MSTQKINYRQARVAAQDAYLAGQTDHRVLAQQFGVAPRTVSNWISRGSWRKMAKEMENLEIRADRARKRAVVKALEEFAADPRNTQLQALVALLRNEAKRLEPAKELNEYIIKFLDQTTDFFLEKGYNGLLKEFQAIIVDLSEYLRIRNV
ncbi:MAG: hypothetical protein PHC50_03435 [Candidatus Cloacimonetes bacterium]|nr:hypothetical protein [Candidatus Cloacimonadota bacterium]